MDNLDTYYTTACHEDLHTEVKELWRSSNFNNIFAGSSFNDSPSDPEQLQAHDLPFSDILEDISSYPNSLTPETTSPTDPYPMGHELYGMDFSQIPSIHVGQSSATVQSSQLSRILESLTSPVSGTLPDGRRVLANPMEIIGDGDMCHDLQHLVYHFSRRIIGMQPTTIRAPDSNGVVKSRTEWRFPTSRPQPPHDAYIPRWDQTITHPANVAFLAKVIFEVQVVLGSVYTPEEIAKAAIAYLKTLFGNYRAQTTQVGKENRARKRLRDRLLQWSKREAMGLSVVE